MCCYCAIIHGDMKTRWRVVAIAGVAATVVMVSLWRFRPQEEQKRAFCVYTYEEGCVQTNQIIKTVVGGGPRMGTFQDPGVILRDDVAEFLSRMSRTQLANEFSRCTSSNCCGELDAAVFESLTFETAPQDSTVKVSVSAESGKRALSVLEFTMRHFEEFVEMKRRTRNEKAVAHLRYKMKQMERNGEKTLSISNLINETWARTDACGKKMRLLVPPTCAGRQEGRECNTISR